VHFSLRFCQSSINSALPPGLAKFLPWPIPISNPTLRPATAMNKLQKIHLEQMKPESTDVNVGDTVKVHSRVIEGGKERIQIYAGIVIARQGIGVSQNMTVRKISYGEGVERVFPIHSPKVAKVEVTKRGLVRRAKLNYLRNRIGKDAVTVKEVKRA
jgi:large subunit ribosomal protein L19